MKHKSKKRKVYPENPGIVEAPNLFKDYLNISCLTQDQLDVFHSEERFLWVEGPAGSGKTIVMLGKIIDIVANKDTEGRVLVMTAGPRTKPALIRCHEVLDNISDDVSCTVVEYFFDDPEPEDQEHINEVSAEAERNLLYQLSGAYKSRIVILAICRTRTLTPERTYIKNIIESFSYVFVDDYQQLAEKRWDDSVLVDKDNDHRNMLSVGLLPVIMNPSANNTNLWVLCDAGQSLKLNSPNGSFIFGLSDTLNNIHNLKDMFEVQKMFSVNLRNTHEISTVLSVIREHWETMEFTVHGSDSLILEVIPYQKNGHFLRGTKPTIYLLRDDHPALYLEILEGELFKLRGPYSGLDNKDIAVLYETEFHDSERVMELLDMWNNEIAVLDIEDCMSAEWPAVVYLHKYKVDTETVLLTDDGETEKEITSSFTVPALYSALCRGRVYSTAIIYNYTPNTCQYTDILLSELRKRKDVCRILDLSVTTIIGSTPQIPGYLSAFSPYCST